MSCALRLALRWVGAVLAAAAVVGCAQVSDRVVLLPGADGRPSAVVVTTPQGATVLDKPYAEAKVTDGQAALATVTPEQVRERYGELLAAVPQRAQTFVLYFDTGADELTADSKAELARMNQALGQRVAGEVVVTGHTDRVGSVEANDRLSLVRANAVRDMLVAAGVPAGSVTVAGRGEREPLVATADEVAESRNRRVEIKLR